MYETLSNLSLRNVLRLGYCVVGLLLVAVCGVAIKAFNDLIELNDRQDEVNGQIEMVTKWAGVTQLSLARYSAMGMVGKESPLFAHLKEASQETLSLSESYSQQAEKSFQDDELRSLLRDLVAKRAQYRAVREQVFNSATEDVAANIVLVKTVMEPVVVDYRARQLKLIEALRVRASDLDVRMKQLVAHARQMLLGSLVLALVVGVSVSRMTAGVVARAIAMAVESAKEIASGNLNVAMPRRRSDELGQLFSELNDMQSSLKRIVSKVRAGTEEVNVAANEIAAGTNNLSERTEFAASNIQQTASSMQELTQSVARTSETARTADEMAVHAHNEAQSGEGVVKSLISMMSRLNETSARVSEITSVIDAIAFQTNILALNAAVEAARAGEQGRGFAVVAGEVRALAQRSGEAAKEIRTLISQSVEQVGQGSSMADMAGQRLRHISASAEQVSTLITQMAGALQAQRHGVEGISRAFASLDESTQQNSALVEQSAAAASGLRNQAVALNEAVQVFRV